MFCILVTLLALGFVACVNEDDATPDGMRGCLRLSLSNISATTTRATPSELGVPSATDFRLRILNKAGRAVYDDFFTEDDLELPIGEYTVFASFGSNSELAIDAPYYVGATKATIRKDETTKANIKASVGNALVSVIFGRNAEEKARFDRYYSEYSLCVYIGDHSLAITNAEPSSSIYLQAGHDISLVFSGKLKMENDREVNTVLSSSELPTSLNAADHLIVTLTLPDPESAVGVDIAKVELETVTLEETIPLSWLPVPTVVATNQFDRKGFLVGSDLIFSNGYPGMKWKAEVTKKGSAEILRMVEGEGALTSSYKNSKEWPYLPQGTYVATYYIVSDDGSAKKSSSREFVVPAPTGLKVTVDGYSSYTKYMAGEVDAANDCDRLTIYEPYVAVNISETLLNNSRYGYTFTYTYDGTSTQIANGRNNLEMENIENQAIRLTPHVLKANLVFDGVSVENQKSFRITGLPVMFAPPSEGNGWSATTSCVTFSDAEVLLGKRGGILTDYNELIVNSNFAIPYDTRLTLTYDIMIHPATQGTNLTFLAGDDAIYVQVQAGGVGNSTDYPFQGSASITLTADITEMSCKNSYGGGQSCSHIYSLHYKYGK